MTVWIGFLRFFFFFFFFFAFIAALDDIGKFTVTYAVREVICKNKFSGTSTFY